MVGVAVVSGILCDYLVVTGAIYRFITLGMVGVAVVSGLLCDYLVVTGAINCMITFWSLRKSQSAYIVVTGFTGGVPSSRVQPCFLP